jgi:hypothetical protein
MTDIQSPVAPSRGQLAPPKASTCASGRIGATGDWMSVMAARGIASTPFQPSNCGVAIDWPEYVRASHAGAPLKRIALTCAGHRIRGEAVVTATGLEGGAVYALSPALRAELARSRTATLMLDLRPDETSSWIANRLAAWRPKESTASALRRHLRLAPAAVAILRAACPDLPRDAGPLAELIKAVPLTISGLAPIATAISSAGGLSWKEIDGRMMLRAVPGAFVAGEMLDWDAPTGGYLLQAVFATGIAAANGVTAWLAADRHVPAAPEWKGAQICA